VRCFVDSRWWEEYNGSGGELQLVLPFRVTFLRLGLACQKLSAVGRNSWGEVEDLGRLSRWQWSAVGEGRMGLPGEALGSRGGDGVMWLHQACDDGVER